MNEKLIQQVVDIERQARKIYESAVREAEQLPIKAEQDVHVMLEKTRSEAQAEAKRLVSQAQGEQETARILDEVEGKNKQMEAIANKNSDRAISFIIECVVGGE